MTPSKHTPGPWQVARFNPDTAYCDIETAERGNDLPDQGYQVAIVPTLATEPGPNANLIAAAPDLLTALEGLMEAIAGIEPWYTLDPALIAVNHAIAKAKGVNLDDD